MVFGLFADVTPAAATDDGGDLKMVCQWQGWFPDFCVHLLTHDVLVNLLAELKVISAGPTCYYHHGYRKKAVDARANSLPREYKL